MIRIHHDVEYENTYYEVLDIWREYNMSKKQFLRLVHELEEERKVSTLEWGRPTEDGGYRWFDVVIEEDYYVLKKACDDFMVKNKKGKKIKLRYAREVRKD